MCLNGVVLPDLTPKPGAYEIKNIQAPIRIKPANILHGKIILENRYMDNNLDHLYLIWGLIENGISIQSGTIDSLYGKASEYVEIYGKGPHENYIDRKNSSLVGLYKSTVDKQHFPFILPVECGGKEDVRWFALRNNTGVGLAIMGFNLLHFDAHRNSVEDYAKARHNYELIPRDEIFVDIDCRHSGLGGDTDGTRLYILSIKSDQVNIC